MELNLLFIKYLLHLFTRVSNECISFTRGDFSGDGARVLQDTFQEKFTAKIIRSIVLPITLKNAENVLLFQ